MFSLNAFGYLDIMITFFIGLLIGLAIKKGLMAFILFFVAVILSGFVVITFLPKFSALYIISLGTKYFADIINSVSFGTVAISISIALFVIGLVIGILKG